MAHSLDEMSSTGIIIGDILSPTMRVIAGKAKSHRLKSLRGSGIHPTSDMVRGAIFSMLESVATDWSKVLDLYAGTGALGIEALSRGAEWADFVEKNPRLCTIIKQNLKSTGFTAQGAVYCMTAEKALTILEGKYGIVLMDPPYNEPSISLTAEDLASSRLIGEDSTIVIEHSRRAPLRERYANFRQIRDIRHGDTCVSVYQYARGEP